MADVIVASGSHIRDDHGVPVARKVFEAPSVEDLGKLQALTQLLQGSVVITP
jgi:hypothetical protein